MILKDLINGIEIKQFKGNLSQEIKGIAYDSRKVEPGFLFICITGFKTDGHLFSKQAMEKGAVAILAQKDIEIVNDCSLIITNNTRISMSIIASNFYNQPSKGFNVIGVTGTNGKTTTTHIIKKILEENKKSTAIVGTLYAKFGDIEFSLNNTTPESVELESFFKHVNDKQGEYLVMEVSSHALDLHRVDKVDFNVAVFTNLTQDHLDYHNNMEDYKNTKLKLFNMVSYRPDGYSVINIDDEYAEDFIKVAGKNVVTYGLNEKADVRATNVKISLKGSTFTVNYQSNSFEIKMNLIGIFSVYNALASIALALKERISVDIIQNSLQKVEGIAGRFEQVNNDQDFTVIVDYAHTPDGLENILTTAKEIVENKLITVFGCGGDRDPTKRPLMGKIAAQYSDLCIVTSDNPRSEEPQNIINDILPGIKQVTNSNFEVIVDRRDAIKRAISLAASGDLIIIAGKGHETYQIVKDRVLKFDDKKVAREFLKGNLG